MGKSPKLTKQQERVLALLAEGLSCAEISKRLSVSFMKTWRLIEYVQAFKIREMMNAGKNE